MMAGVDAATPHGIRLAALDSDIVDLHGLAALHHLRRDPHAFADDRHAIDALERDGIGLVWVITRPQAKLLACLVVLPDGAACGPGELVRPQDDRLEHGLEIQRRTESTADLTEGSQLPHGTGQILRASFEFLEQS